MFDWDDANISHVAEHNILPAEAEEVVIGKAKTVEYQNFKGELRIRQIGETALGRILTVVTTIRHNLIRVVTAFPANRSQRAEYLLSKGPTSNESTNHPRVPD